MERAMAPRHSKTQQKEYHAGQPDGAALPMPGGLSPEAKRWIEENQEFFRSSNEYVEKHGLPLAKYRIFQWQD
jgi:hypothetical protein